jgi:O-methyltransferase
MGNPSSEKSGYLAFPPKSGARTRPPTAPGLGVLLLQWPVMDVSKLIDTYPLVSDQIEKDELLVILTELARVLEKGIAGDVVEFGCFVGTTALFLQRLLAGSKTLHVYDSFEGLPVKDQRDESPLGKQFEPGKLFARKTDFIRNFKKAGLPLPHIHKDWFKDIQDNQLPGQIAFAFLDGDYYESVMTSLQLIWPRLSRGAVVIVDDYHNEALPGAAKAVDEWLTTHKVATFRAQASLAVMVTAPR